MRSAAGKAPQSGHGTEQRAVFCPCFLPRCDCVRPGPCLSKHSERKLLRFSLPGLEYFLFCLLFSSMVPLQVIVANTLSLQTMKRGLASWGTTASVLCRAVGATARPLPLLRPSSSSATSEVPQAAASLDEVTHGKYSTGAADDVWGAPPWIHAERSSERSHLGRDSRLASGLPNPGSSAWFSSFGDVSSVSSQSAASHASTAVSTSASPSASIGSTSTSCSTPFQRHPSFVSPPPLAPIPAWSLASGGEVLQESLFPGIGMSPDGNLATVGSPARGSPGSITAEPIRPSTRQDNSLADEGGVVPSVTAARPAAGAALLTTIPSPMACDTAAADTPISAAAAGPGASSASSAASSASASVEGESGGSAGESGGSAGDGTDRADPFSSAVALATTLGLGLLYFSHVIDEEHRETLPYSLAAVLKFVHDHSLFIVESPTKVQQIVSDVRTARQETQQLPSLFERLKRNFELGSTHSHRLALQSSVRDFLRFLDTLEKAKLIKAGILVRNEANQDVIVGIDIEKLNKEVELAHYRNDERKLFQFWQGRLLLDFIRSTSTVAQIQDVFPAFPHVYNVLKKVDITQTEARSLAQPLAAVSALRNK